jgi:hypothetical protein
VWKEGRVRIGGRGRRQDDHGYIGHEHARITKFYQNEVRIGPAFSFDFANLALEAKFMQV